MTDDELRELLARTSPGTAKKDWKHGLQPATIAGICAELLAAREEIARLHEPFCCRCRMDCA